MDLPLTPGPRGSRVRGLYAQLREAILDGRLAAGERLPPTRELAAELGVSRGTAVSALERLVADGLVATKPGAGSYVARRGVAPAVRRAPRSAPLSPRPIWTELPPVPPDPAPARFDLSFGGPDPTLFPLAVWRRLAAEVLRGGFGAVPAYSTEASAPLSDQIARQLGRTRSVRAVGSDVLVTAGTQQALDLIARVLVQPGDTVAVEDPGYPACVRLFASHGARVVGVDVDQDGLVVDALPDRARLVYVTPSHQFPTGVTMSPCRRAELLSWAARRGAVIVEDDYDSEFRFEQRPLEPLQAMDDAGRVIYVGSFSKVLLPGLRVGFLVAPGPLQDALRTAKQLTDWSGDALTHGVLTRFLYEGHLALHLRRTSRIYAQRRTALLCALDEVPGLEVIPSVAGLHVAALFRDRSVDDVAVVAHAADADVCVEPLSPRYLGPGLPGLVFGFRHITAERIPAAIRRLATVLSKS